MELLWTSLIGFCMFLHMEIPGILRAMNFGLFKQVGACHLCSEEIALISFTRGASLQAALGFHSLNHSTGLRKRHTNILQNKVMLMLWKVKPSSTMKKLDLTCLPNFHRFET